jgi:cytoskeletal protein RodZ
MTNIGEILRRAREEQGKSLDEIATTTNINKKFLVDIEQGNAIKLPDTYVRAFIKAYALQVGLDPDRLLRESHEPSSEDEPSVQPKLIEQAPVVVNGTRHLKSSQVKGNPTLILLIVAALAVTALVVMIFWMRSERSRKPVQEVSFSDVVRERESVQQGNAQPIAIPDSLAGVRRDSLVLEGITSGSEWIRIVRDTLSAKEYTLPAGARVVWKAGKYFILSVGNVKAVSFKLNGRSIGLPSKSAANLSNIKLSWETLDTLSQKVPPVSHANKDSLSKAAKTTKPVKP